MKFLRHNLIPFLLLTAVILPSCTLSETGISKTEKPTYSAHWQAGEPVALARRSALSDWTISGEISTSQIKKCFDASSESTIKQYSIFLSPFSDNEIELLEKLKNSKPPIVTRTSVERLKGIFIQQALLSPREAVRRGVITERAVTPGSEDVLLGAFDCVFATIGPWNGTPRYGEVIIRLKDSVRELGWATPWSGYSFLHWMRKKDTDKIDSLIKNNSDTGINKDDMLLYLMFVISGKDWNTALGYEAIVFLRAQDQITQAQKVEIIEKLLGMDNPEEFWKFFLGKHYQKGPMGYLEAKFPSFLPAEYFESIEVPKDSFSEIISWPEAQQFKNIIRVKTEK